MAKLGDRIDKFTLVRQLGAGGMGATWEAVRQSGHDFEQRVAIKLAEPEVLATTDGLDSFRREAALAASLRHPSIAAVLDIDDHGGYIVCELVDGADLRAVLKAVPGGRLDPVITVHVIGQIARGLAHAHRRILRGRSSPVIHRDMSPGNVVIDYDGNVKIVDFGIAKAMISGPDMPEALKGKLSYMAPEQVMGGRMDGRVDQYALGVIAYEALTGVRPNDGAHEGETLSCILGGKRVPIGQRLPALASGLARIVERMLALRPEQRFPSMDALLDALSAFTPPLTTHRNLIPLVIAARQPHTIVHENGRFVSRPVDIDPILSALQPSADDAAPPLQRRRDAGLTPGQQALLATLGSTDPAAPSAGALFARAERARAAFGGATESDAPPESRAPQQLMAAAEREQPLAPAVARILPTQIIGASQDLARTEQAAVVARDAGVGRARAAVVREGQAPVIVSRELAVSGATAHAMSGVALDDTAVAPGSRQHVSGEFVHVTSQAADARDAASPPLVVREGPVGHKPVASPSLRDSQRQLIGAHTFESLDSTVLGLPPASCAASERFAREESARAAAAPHALGATVHESSPLLAARLPGSRSASGAIGAAAQASSVPPALPSARTKVGSSSTQSEVRRTHAADPVAVNGRRSQRRRRLFHRSLFGVGAALLACAVWLALSPDALTFSASPAPAPTPVSDRGVTVHSVAPGARGASSPPTERSGAAASPATESSLSPLTAAEGTPAPAPVPAQPAAPPMAAEPASPPTAADATQRLLPDGFAHARVRVSPHAQVWVDDQLQGEAAPLLRLTLSAGTHVIAVGQDAPLQARTVELKSGSSTLIAFDLREP